MSGVTRLLDAAASGDRKAAADLLSLVYEELLKLAATRTTAEPAADAGREASPRQRPAACLSQKDPSRGGAT
jgi:hypothetical protein